jgi:hypothetical protein
MTAMDQSDAYPSHPDVEPSAQTSRQFDRTPGRIVVVAMLLLFAAMSFGLAAIVFSNLGQSSLLSGVGPNLTRMYQQYLALFQGIACLCGIAWLPCLLFGIILCAKNPLPPLGLASQGGEPRD